MSSILSILLQQWKQQNRIPQNNQIKNINTTHHIVILLFKLIQKRKYNLISTIFQKLKKQSQNHKEFNKKDKNYVKLSYDYQQMLTQFTLSKYVNIINQQFNNINNKSSLQEILTPDILNFFIQNIFSYRKITDQEQQILEDLFIYFKRNQNRYQMENKIALVLQFNQKRVNQKQQSQKIQQNKNIVNATVKPFLLLTQANLNIIKYNQEGKIKQLLSKLINQDLIHEQINQKIMLLIIKKFKNKQIILNQLKQVIQYLENCEDLSEYILQQQNLQITQTRIQKQNYQWWLKFLFCEELLKYLFFQLSRQDSNKCEILKSNQFFQILNIITSTYLKKIVYVYQIMLKQGLQNDLKNNFYLSEHNKHQILNNLFNLMKYWILTGNQQLSQIHRNIQIQNIFGLKYLNQSKMDLQNKYSRQILLNQTQINQTIKKICNFFTEQNNIENRFLTLQQFDSKNIQSIFIKKQQKEIQSFKKLFLVDSSKQQIKTVKNVIKFKNNLIDITSQRIFNNIFINLIQKNQQKITCITFLSQIIELFNLQNESSNFLSKSFIFYSPTFNNQYLTFSYVFNDPKEHYFYQNHHYCHVVLQIYQSILNKLLQNQDIYQKQQKQNIFIDIFNHFRNILGKYAEQHLLQANSQQFYEYLNLWKFYYVTISKRFLQQIPLNQIILFFDLIINEIIIKQNHPLIRQYIQIILGRCYFFMKQNAQKLQNQQILNKFYNCRNRMINMLNYEQNQNNLNISVPILLIIGYELLQFMKLNPKNNKSKINLIQKSSDIQDQYGSMQIKSQHEEDIHYILAKYISCHVAYLRAICQYYLLQYIKIISQNKQKKIDTLLENLLKFWQSDKDSQKILLNIGIPIQGFKKQMEIFKNHYQFQNFYLCLQRVYEAPNQLTSYFFIRDTIQIFKKTIKNQQICHNYQIKQLLRQKVIKLQQKARNFELKQVQDFYQINNKQQQTHERIKQNKKNNKKDKYKKQSKKIEIVQQKIQQKKQKLTKMESLCHIQTKIENQYNKYQNINQPDVIIIATLLQKVHNFGYLVRTLTNRNAMLVVPSKQPFLHPECIELMPSQDLIDVQVIQLKNKNLQSFIKMYQKIGYPLIALEQCSKSIQLQKTQFPQKYMLLLGNQRIGAPAALLNMADILVQIPQVGKIRSLNVHVSMVICFWQYLKQHDKDLNPEKKDKLLSIK